MASIRVLLVDDHELLREALRCLFELDGAIEVVGEAEDGDTAIEMAQRLRPDVVVTDVAHPGCDGYEVTRRIVEQDRDAKVLLHSAYVDATCVAQGLEAGARGYVFKDDPTSLMNAIKTVAGGGEVFDRDPSLSRKPS